MDALLITKAHSNPLKTVSSVIKTVYVVKLFCFLCEASKETVQKCFIDTDADFDPQMDSNVAAKSRKLTDYLGGPTGLFPAEGCTDIIIKQNFQSFNRQ